MFRRYTLAFLFLLVVCIFAVMGVQAQRRVVIAEWNVENLFDTIDDDRTADEAFLPQGEYHWTSGRYWRKLNAMAGVLSALGGDAGMPAVLGLCEVENDSVMRDLTRRSALRTAGYEFVMTKSADHRGVDVVFLYNPNVFRLVSWHPVRVPSLQHGYSPTRDILYAKGVVPSYDTLHFVLCHLPSKSGSGRSATRHRRLAVQTLYSIVDSLMNVDPNAKLLVMGDFNASYDEQIFRQLCPPLQETLPTSRQALMRPVGTYYYQRQWSYLDHILVSPALADWQRSLQHPCASAEVRLPMLLTREGTPNRTYKGPFYNGGISDHLPLKMELWY